jgi:hypothetical protein
MMAEKFLSEEEYTLLQNMFLKKGFPLFHIIAFNNDDMNKPTFNMVSSLNAEYDLVTLKEIIEIFSGQLSVMCADLMKGTMGTGKDDIGEPKGAC